MRPPASKDHKHLPYCTSAEKRQSRLDTDGSNALILWGSFGKWWGYPLIAPNSVTVHLLAGLDLQEWHTESTVFNIKKEKQVKITFSTACLLHIEWDECYKSFHKHILDEIWTNPTRNQRDWIKKIDEKWPHCSHKWTFTSHSHFWTAKFMINTKEGI